MCTRFDSEVNSHMSTRKLVTTLILTMRDYSTCIVSQLSRNKYCLNQTICKGYLLRTKNNIHTPFYISMTNEFTQQSNTNSVHCILTCWVRVLSILVVTGVPSSLRALISADLSVY